MLPTHIKPSDYGRNDSYILELAIKQLRIRCKTNVLRFIRRHRIVIVLTITVSIVFSVLRLLGKPVEAL